MGVTTNGYYIPTAPGLQTMPLTATLAVQGLLLFHFIPLVP